MALSAWRSNEPRCATSDWVAHQAAAAGSHTKMSRARHAIFVTTESVYWEGRRPEPGPFWLRDGMRTRPGQWFLCDQTSSESLWWRNSPFHVVHGYELLWEDLGSAGRFLLVTAAPQSE